MPIYYDHLKMNQQFSDAYTIGLIETSAHMHYDVEIACVLKGTVKIAIDEKPYTISEGGLFFINSASVHAYKAEGNYALLAFLGINRSLVDSLFPDLQTKYIHFVIPDCTDTSAAAGQVRTLLLSAYQNFIKNNNTHTLFNHSIAIFILSLLHEHFLTDRPSKNSIRMDNYARSQQIEAYILKNYNKDINIQMLAEHIHLSPYYTSHYFKKIYQVTFNQYLTALRVVNAKYMLHEPDISITEIALSCGFSSSASFSRIFKAEEGISPSDYRRKHLLSNAPEKLEHTGLYRTQSGFYISFTPNQHQAFLNEALSKFGIDEAAFHFLTD